MHAPAKMERTPWFQEPGRGPQFQEHFVRCLRRAATVLLNQASPEDEKILRPAAKPSLLKKRRLLGAIACVSTALSHLRFMVVFLHMHVESGLASGWAGPFVCTLLHPPLIRGSSAGSVDLFQRGRFTRALASWSFWLLRIARTQISVHCLDSQRPDKQCCLFGRFLCRIPCKRIHCTRWITFNKWG